MNRFLKRALVGKPVSSHAELQHRLSKRVALAVFSSDALSSSAYATDEILLVLLAAGSASFAVSLPIALAVALVLSVVIVSYRQTVRAYPRGGGAYIVAHTNLGVLPGLIAAASLLIDYVLTVSVSVAAGVAAVGAALPGLRDDKLAIALGVVALITALNIRGLKESGTIFSVPTYGFLACMVALLGVGAIKGSLGGGGTPAPAVGPVQALTLFLVLRAFSSGSTALTGVEAISDGVPAFRPPEWRNAATTLGILGGILTVLFLGITFLSQTFGVDPRLIEHGETVVSQIAKSVFGGGSLMFYAVQFFTALILFLAANTAYADFPRLSSILARDRYLPRVFRNRGDRLAFTNGILILAAAAMVVLINYRADVHRIIPLYVIGVFTSFTLSQAGMVVHQRRRGRAGSGPKAAVSAFGASVTFLVLVVVATTKFPLGAWQVIILIPLVAFVLFRINTHYGRVADELRLEETPPALSSNRIVLVVTRFRGATKALSFARALAPDELRVAAFRVPPARMTDLRNRWSQLGKSVVIDEPGSRIGDLVEFVEALSPSYENPVTVMLPDPQYLNPLRQIVGGFVLLRIKRAFLVRPGVVVVSVPFDPQREPEPVRIQAPTRFSVIVLISAVNRATIQALRYAQGLRPSELKAMTIEVEPGESAEVMRGWSRMDMRVPLEILDSPFRSLIQPLRVEIQRLRSDEREVVAVVVPEFIVRGLWRQLLHNQTALLVKTALLLERGVVVINVPYHLTHRARGKASKGSERERIGTGR